MQSEISHTQKDKYHMSSLTYKCFKSQLEHWKATISSWKGIWEVGFEWFMLCVCSELSLSEYILIKVKYSDLEFVMKFWSEYV